MSYPSGTYAEKYRMTFFTPEGDTATVRFRYRDAGLGLIAHLDPGARPFVISEYNGSGDLFKHTRGMMATIQIVNTNGILMDDFIAAEDAAIVVDLEINGALFWRGMLIQDDFEEPWSDRAHYINLRATDGLGTIFGELGLPTTAGQGTILDYLAIALWDLPNSLPLTVNRYYACNLFYEGMDDRNDGAFTPLDQVTTDVRTFQGDNRAKTLEKILQAWGMTVLQVAGSWFFIRLEEYLSGNPIKFIRIGAVTRGNITPADNFIQVGNNELVKVLAPDMLRGIRRPFTKTKVIFKYIYPDEIVCNQSFQAGAIIVPTLVTFEIDCWTLEQAPLNDAPAASSADWWREEEKDVDGNILDNYAYIGPAALETWMTSQPMYLSKEDAFDISIEYKNSEPTSTTVNIAIIQFWGDSGQRYTMDDDGVWIPATGIWSGMIQHLTLVYATGESALDWKQYAQRSKKVPEPGYVVIRLAHAVGAADTVQFRNLEIEIREASKLPGVIGDFDRYTIPQFWAQDYEEEIFLDDTNNRQHRGALFFSGQLTGDRWYRMDYPAERLTFKRHKAISLMLQHQRIRMKLEVVMLGLKKPDGTPLWIHNRIVFVDDAPGKKFMIANLKEMDFASGRWSATLVEIWDDVLDSTDDSLYPPHDFANIYEKDV